MSAKRVTFNWKSQHKQKQDFQSFVFQTQNTVYIYWGILLALAFLHNICVFRCLFPFNIDLLSKLKLRIEQQILKTNVYGLFFFSSFADFLFLFYMLKHFTFLVAYKWVWKSFIFLSFIVSLKFCHAVTSDFFMCTIRKNQVCLNFDINAKCLV